MDAASVKHYPLSMNTRLPVFLVQPERRLAWEQLLWEQGFEPVATTDLPDPVVAPDEARRWLADLAARNLEPAVDPLTGLPTRRQALRVLEEEAGLEGEPLWLALANVDNFKKINDNFGHALGEEVLTEIGRLTLCLFAGASVLGRIGGDTNLIALRGEKDSVRGALIRLLEAVRNAGYADRFLLTLSVGLARHRPGEEIDELIDRADRNLYAAKNRGRDRIVDESEFAEGTSGSDIDFELADFENRVRVFADRLVSGLSGRGRRMVETHRDEADHDGLTGLYNRRYFDRRLVREVQRSRKLASPLTIVLLDLDDFAAVNRLHGFAEGDKALQEAAQVVLKGIRVVDWAARSGGQELCAVFPDTGSDIALVVAERIRKALEGLELPASEGPPLRLTGSLGVVTLSPSDTGAPAFLARAAQAVRASKAAGKNRVTLGGEGA